MLRRIKIIQRLNFLPSWEVVRINFLFLASRYHKIGSLYFFFPSYFSSYLSSQPSFPLCHVTYTFEPVTVEKPSYIPVSSYILPVSFLLLISWCAYRRTWKLFLKFHFTLLCMLNGRSIHFKNWNEWTILMKFFNPIRTNR